jgi:hypothetical protein
VIQFPHIPLQAYEADVAPGPNPMPAEPEAEWSCILPLHDVSPADRAIQPGPEDQDMNWTQLPHNPA